MKTEEVFIPSLNRKIDYYIGKNAKDNFKIIDMCEPEDLWFHVKNESSCHVIALIAAIFPIEKKELDEIIKEGAQLCKENTAKVADLKYVSIDYTLLKNIKKTKKLGCVMVENVKTIVC